MQHLRQVVFSSVIVLCCAAGLKASAFSINELGARASGMAGAFIAIADDGSALFYNPAGIAFQKGFRMEMDGLLVSGQFRFVPFDAPAGTVVPKKGFDGYMRPQIVPVGNLYLTKQLSEKWTFGFGAFAPFGLGANWTNFNDADPSNTKFVARFVSSRPKMISLWAQPTVAYRINENSSLAVAAAFVHTHVFLEQSILNPLDEGRTFGVKIADVIFPGQDPDLAGRSIARLLPEGRSRLAATAQSPGFAAGYLYKHRRSKTNIGLMYRSAVVHHFKGKASFAFTENYPLRPFIGVKEFTKRFPKQDARVNFTTPGTYGIGVSNSSFWNSLLSFDFQIQDYRRFKDVVVNFTETKDTGTPAEARLTFDFRNSYIWRFGIERPLNENMTVRAGYFFDHTPVPDKSVGPLWPDSSRHNVTVGASWLRGNKEFSVFYQAMQFINRTVDVPDNAKLLTNGEYRNFAHLAGFSLRIHLGVPTLEAGR